MPSNQHIPCACNILKHFTPHLHTVCTQAFVATASRTPSYTPHTNKNPLAQLRHSNQLLRSNWHHHIHRTCNLHDNKSRHKFQRLICEKHTDIDQSDYKHNIQTHRSARSKLLSLTQSTVIQEQLDDCSCFWQGWGNTLHDHKTRVVTTKAVNT